MGEHGIQMQYINIALFRRVRNKMHIASNIVYCVNVESIFSSMALPLRIRFSLEDRGPFIMVRTKKVFPARASYFAISGDYIFWFCI